MYLFHNDYNECCHPLVLQKMMQLQQQQMPGYGCDPCCEAAADMIRDLCECADATVHFLVGGTQTNLIVIASALRPYQAVLAAATGHINVHETGAIEATGHKVVALPAIDGKLTAAQIAKVAEDQLADETAEHVTQIKMVYISNSTELGTIYTLRELENISSVCRKYGYYLFVDGARLSYALTAKDSDVTLADMARLCDAFYIGGTKCGAMFGEALVITNPAISENFRYMIKQRGAMLAKGWLLGLQFQALLENDLYFEIAAHANRLADQLRETLDDLGYQLLISGNTNQVFPILPNRVLDALSKEFTFSLQEIIDDEHKAVRFCTSWATTQESMDALCDALMRYTQ
jgi:threonine aldolase